MHVDQRPYDSVEAGGIGQPDARGRWCAGDIVGRGGWWHWNDRQSWDQAVMVARHSTIDFDDLRAYAHEEGADLADIEKLRQQAGDR